MKMIKSLNITQIILLFLILFFSFCVFSCERSDDDDDEDIGPSGGGDIDYSQAAAEEYDKLLDAWFCHSSPDDPNYEHTLMWYQGNAMDTLIDYIAITNDKDKGKVLADKIDTLWKIAEPEGAWWDDFGWWGIAFMNAANNYDNLNQPNDEKYVANAQKNLEEHMEYATKVWDYAQTSDCLNEGPENWYQFEPRFDNGVWNSAFAGLNTGDQAGCNPNTDGQDIFPGAPNIPVGTPGDLCSQLNPLQNTVTNGLYLVLNSRYYLLNSQSGGSREAQTKKIYGWFKNWLELDDNPVALCYGNETKPSLLNSETGLIRERVGTYAMDNTEAPACYVGVKWYEPDLAWAGDQGIILGGLVDMINSKLTDDDTWLLETAKGILDGVKDHMTKGYSGSTSDTLATGVLRPWTQFDGWGPDDVEKTAFASPGGFGFGDPDYPQAGDPEHDIQNSCNEGFTQALDSSTNYISGPGIFMRYLVYAYKNNEDLKQHIQSEDYLAFIKTNADAMLDGKYSCSCKNTIDLKKYDACNVSCQINRLATLNAAIAILEPENTTSSADE